MGENKLLSAQISTVWETLYQLLSGYDPSLSPFRFPPLQSLVPTLPKRLVELITQMIEMDASKRPEHITVVEQELQQMSGSAATIDKTPRRRMPKPHMPMLSIPLPTPASVAPTQYATPSAQYMPGQQIFAPLRTSLNMEAMPAQQSSTKEVSASIGKVLSIVMIVIGVLIALLGFLLFFSAGEGVFNNLWVGGIVFLFGLIIIFIGRIRKSSLPLSKARKIESTIGMPLVIVTMIFGVAMSIIGAIISADPSKGGVGPLAGIVIIIEGAIIWLVTRIRIKKTL
jgi:hypothetical protein